jgi:hypothetical protein
MIKRLNNAKRQTNYLVCNIEVSDFELVLLMPSNTVRDA